MLIKCKAVTERIGGYDVIRPVSSDGKRASQIQYLDDGTYLCLVDHVTDLDPAAYEIVDKAKEDQLKVFQGVTKALDRWAEPNAGVKPVPDDTAKAVP